MLLLIMGSSRQCTLHSQCQLQSDHALTVLSDSTKHPLQYIIVDYDVEGTDAVEVSVPDQREDGTGQEHYHPHTP